MISKKIGETEYCIGWIPFGGYVKLTGETPQENNSYEPSSFQAKPVGIRIAVLFAGPFMNIILGIVLIWAVFWGYGESVPEYDVPKIGSTVINMPAQECGLSADDLIVAIDGDSVSSWEQMANIIHSKPNLPITITVQRGDSLFTVECVPDERKITLEGNDTLVGMIGILPSSIQRKLPPGQAFLRSIQATITISFAVISFLGNLLVGKSSLSEIGGPVMIAQIAGQSAKLGVWQLFMFIAALSINLALLNLFPLPILDGGQILLSTIEAIRKKAISLKTQAIFQQLSIAFLLALMLLVTINDILRLF